MSASAPKSIRWHKAALRDLEEIVAYIAQDKPAADRFAESVFAKVESWQRRQTWARSVPITGPRGNFFTAATSSTTTVSKEEVVVRSYMALVSFENTG